MFKSVAAAAVGAVVVGASADDVSKAFKKFMKDFNREYETEEARWEKFQNFKATYNYIAEENAKGHTYTLGINDFSDMSVDEFAKTHFGYNMPSKPWGSLPNLGTHVYNGEPLADSMDWVSKGAVTPVKNQGQCGSCWSFSTTGSLEGAYEIASGKLVSMSEENLVQCSKNGNMGCNCGSMDLAFEFVEKNGICTEASYPYTSGAGVTGQCTKASSCTKALTAGAVTGFHDVQKNSMQAMMSALQKGPVSIAVEADKAIFQSYRQGVMTGMCGTKLDHGILVVGYGTESGADYWKVKNS
jgi:cathepsin L